MNDTKLIHQSYGSRNPPPPQKKHPPLIFVNPYFNWSMVSNITGSAGCYAQMVGCLLLSWEISVRTTSIALIPAVLSYSTAVHQLCLPRLNLTGQTNRQKQRPEHLTHPSRLIIELREAPSYVSFSSYVHIIIKSFLSLL